MREQRGRVVEVWAQEGYGYVEGEGGRWLRFDRSDVGGGAFGALVVGTEVAFRPLEGAEPRARVVRVLRTDPGRIP